VDTPWHDPKASGIRINPPSRAETQRSIEAYRDAPSLLEGTPFHTSLFDFVFANILQMQVDRYADGELWTARFDHDRMERWIQLRCWRASWVSEIELELTSIALWNRFIPGERPELTCWVVNGGRRWIGMTTASPIPVFAESLELVYSDARSYTTDDLHPAPAGSADAPRGRPWPGAS